MVCNKNGSCNGKNCNGNCGNKGKTNSSTTKKSKENFDYMIDLKSGEIYKHNPKTGSTEYLSEEDIDEIFNHIDESCKENNKKSDDKKRKNDKIDNNTITFQFSIDDDRLDQLFNKLNKVFKHDKFFGSSDKNRSFKSMLLALADRMLSSGMSKFNNDDDDDYDESDNNDLDYYNNVYSLQDIFDIYRIELDEAIDEYSSEINKLLDNTQERFRNVCTRKPVSFDNIKNEVLQTMKKGVDISQFHTKIQKIFNECEDKIKSKWN